MENSSRYLPGSFMMVCMDSMFFWQVCILLLCWRDGGCNLQHLLSAHLTHYKERTERD